jgi:endonuclease YncB( thermonuclease family)
MKQIPAVLLLVTALSCASAKRIEIITEPELTTEKPAPAIVQLQETRPQLQGTVTYVVDGDTADVRLDSGKIERIRFTGIDCVEEKQGHLYAAATKRLAELVDGKRVGIETLGKRTHKRLVGTLRVDGQDPGLVLIREGFCFYAKQYSGELSTADQTLYDTAETEAKAKNLGVWSDPKIEKPWDFRHKGKKRSKKHR